METALALNQNWLDNANIQSGASMQNAQCVGGAITDSSYGAGYGLTGGCVPSYGYQYYGWTYPVYVNTVARPIKLTLSDIDRLRKAAKADKALKAILAKFTDQIEITVDFE